jgi:muramoyltetrapeptide carboxypeptidase
MGAKIYQSPFPLILHLKFFKIFMQIPPYLQPGDCIAITCPSGFISTDTVLAAKSQLETWGFKVVLGATFDQSDNYFSAPDALRAQDLQRFLDDDSVHAILMGRGGYGMSRIIDQLDFSKFVVNPKWICGFSDITVLHSHIQTNFGIATIHGPMCASFTAENLSKDFLKAVKSLLMGEHCTYPVPHSEHNIPGSASGILIGGNLAMLAHLTGSPSQMNARGKILFLEDIGEHLYNIDRMLYNLKRSGAFEGIIGVICGGFTDNQDTTRPFGQSIYEILLHHFKDLGIPIIFDFPAGHIDENFPICLGNCYNMLVSEGKSSVNTLC